MHIHIFCLLLCVDISETQQAVNCTSLGSFPSMAVRSLLLAMKYDSMEARRLFPRLLQIVASYPDTQDSFINLVSVRFVDNRCQRLVSYGVYLRVLTTVTVDVWIISFVFYIFLC